MDIALREVKIVFILGIHMWYTIAVGENLYRFMLKVEISQLAFLFPEPVATKIITVIKMRERFAPGYFNS